jgi:formylglycine-generating enzyme required for sulfatase activity
MGDSYQQHAPDELPLHKVFVDDFYMEKYEVSKVLWDDIRIWAIEHGYQFENSGAAKGTNHPVQSVSWHDVTKWCNARSEKEARKPCYYTSPAKTNVFRSGRAYLGRVSVNWDTDGYRLPTEAEWEKAARGEYSNHHYPWSSYRGHYKEHIAASNANYYGSEHPLKEGEYPWTTAVGSYLPNTYGLYDMAGNVWEWCWDWYDKDYYSVSPRSNPSRALP